MLLGRGRLCSCMAAKEARVPRCGLIQEVSVLERVRRCCGSPAGARALGHRQTSAYLYIRHWAKMFPQQGPEVASFF
jgi:hypothetical protein